MVTIIIIDRKKDQLGQFKNLAHMFSELKDYHIERFLNIIPDIVNMIFIHTDMLVPHRPAHH